MADRLTIGGRQFGIHEYGDGDGYPVFYFHGFPGSRLDGVSLNFDGQLKNAGFRVIAVDRPGIGLSTYDDKWTLLSFADDIAHIADKFNLPIYSVAGFSGGGPYALGASFKYPARVRSAAFIAGMGPVDIRECRKDKAMIVSKNSRSIQKMIARILHAAATNHPALLSTAMRIFLPGRDVSCLSASGLELFFCENLRQGVRGFLKDAELYGQPWGFSLADVSQWVGVWHGSLDRNISRKSVERISHELPYCSTNFMTGEGHFSIICKQFGTILQRLRDQI